MRGQLVFVVGLLALSWTVESANILILLPYPAYSHFNCFYPLFTELKNRKHNLTIVSPFEIKDENINEVNLDEVHKFLLPLTQLHDMDRLSMMLRLHEIANVFIKGSLTHPNFRQLLRNNTTHFDLVMLEFYYNDAYLAVARKFHAPIVALIPQTMQTNIGWRLSNPVDFSFIPMMYLPFSNYMNFIQRTINTIFGMIQVLVYNLKYMQEHQETVNREFGFLADDQRDVYSMGKDIALTLVNTHHSFAYPRPYLPNTIEVGGIHLKKLKPLPKEMQKFMDEATDGVVFISFGTLVDTSIVDSWARVIIQVFANTSLRVMWKWKPSLLQNIPNNFLVQEWFPQNDVLNHPNCTLLFSHGGIHSIIESVNSGVPILAVPFFSDQSHNVAAVEQFGIGISIHDVQKDTLEAALHTILNDASYKKNMNYRRKLFKNRLHDPVTTAAYWVEHILEYKGAEHLKSSAEELTWYQYLLVDVFVFLLFIGGIVIVGLALLMKLINIAIQRGLQKMLSAINIEKKSKTS